MTQLRILHAHSTFSLGGKEARAVRLMNAFGAAARHTILSATGDCAARDAINPAIEVDFPTDAPSLVGKPSPGRYRDIARYMRQFDLVLTYNWGAMDVVGARRLFGGPPLIHHEDGFNQDEIARQKPARVWFRRLMLPAASKVVVPSRTLERIAREVWRQPAARIARIANGIPIHGIGESVPIDGFAPDPDALVIGTIAGLRPIKNIPRLVRAFAAGAPVNARLLVMGEGPERAAILAEAERLGVERRVALPGFVGDPGRAIANCAIFALSSDSEQFPISLIEAMAAGLPAVSTDVGDVALMVAPENRPFVIPAIDEDGLANAIRALCDDMTLRHRVGLANRALAIAEYSEAGMITAYRALYAAAVGAVDGLH